MNFLPFRLLGIICVFLGLTFFIHAQYYETLRGDPNQRKKNVHSGNQVRTTFFNYGLIGRENAAEDFGGEWPINSGHFYVGDISVMVGAEIAISDTQAIRPVTVADGPRGNNEVDPLNSTVFWGWEPLPEFSYDHPDPDSDRVAMSHQPVTWPDRWPDRENDINDPGWVGQWNGFFGKDQFNADQESYWVMDDSRDKEFIRNFGFYPDSTEEGLPEDQARGGLALLSNVRGLQWSQTLAQNTIFWLYDVTNIGTRNYDKTTFGMIVGTTIGGDGDTNDDNSLFSAENNLTFSWDFDNVGNTGWSPVAYLGYAFLDSPGNALNGFDDDGNGADGSGPVINDDLFRPRLASVGDEVVVIDYDDPWFAREVVSFPSEGLQIPYNGEILTINPGDTLKEVPFNNIDDNLNGLVDENTEIPNDGLDNNNNGLIDEENPQLGLKYKDFITGNGIDNPLIDESRADGIDNDGDWEASLDDVGLDGKPSTGDQGEGDGMPTSGFQPIGPGGELVDTGLPGEPNIDKTDIEEGDIIGLTSFFFFAPFNVIKLFNDGNLWNALRPGFFDVGQQNKDGDFIYGTGYFPLQAGQTERISLAFFFGNNREEIFRTKNTVQLIYNNDYNFAKSPRLPGVRAFAGDGEVTLYWDTIAEQSFDRLSQEVTGDPFDFEGYKIYRATFPSWDETGVVRNVFGTRIADVPIAQFDVVDSDSGFFPAIDPELGSVFYLGDNTGLVHTYKDTTVQNGFTYFYAVTAYDHGIFFTNDSTGEQQILQPAETSKFATINQAGEIEAAKNVIVVKPEAPAAGHIPAEVENLEQVEGDGNGEIFVQIVDPLRLKDGHEYELTFEDEGFTRSTKNFTVVDITGGAQDTIINKDPNVDIDAVTFDGTQLHIMNAGRKIGNRWQPLPVPATHLRWSDTTRSIVQPENWNKFQASLTQGTLYPANYRLEVDEMGVDSSAGIPLFGVPPVTTGPVNFRIKNVSEDRYVTFNLYDLPDDEPAASRGKVDESDLIAIFETHDDVVNKLTYSLKFRADSTAEAPQSGDVLELPVNKPFLNYDVFQFKVKEAKEDRSLAQNQLNDIKVVPNPYIATATWEPRNNFSDGRGPREIHFTHLPKECTIRIYNLRGELVDTIDHNSHVTNGTATWDMLTRDQLDISYGVYIYHVDAPGIGEKIGKFAVIK